jgi:CHAT domain-containing protein
LQKAVGPSRPRLWWCATGDLSTLPIHAAGCYNETRTDCTTDYIVPTYVPTLTALTSARRGWRPIPREQLAALVVSAAAPGRGHARLPNVVEEVQAVRKCFRQRGALVVDLENNRDPSCKSILACLGASGVNVLHMACHGFQRLRNPLASAFILNDGDLSIEELMKIQLKDGALAFLSACQTAQGDEEMSEQAIHLAACMLFCGFRSVIGTLWCAVEDGSLASTTLIEVIGP